MREIKFRAYNEGNKTMHHEFQWFSSGDSGSDWICFASLESPQISENNQVILNNPYFRQQLKIMQYTGLNDMKGQEIYEGDKLYWHNQTDEPGADISPVEFRDGAFYCGSDLLAELDLESMEIIGNIYETRV